jgi:thioredoxin-dependent peroxiredoxin
MPNIGDVAPDFELLNQDGKTVKLSDYRGKRVLLFAYPKADTPGCTKQACGFRDAFPKLNLKEVVVLGISPDSPKDQLAWKKKQQLPYDLLSDESHAVLEKLGVWAEKSMFGKKYWGVTRSHWIIAADGTFEDIQVGVSPDDSINKAVKLLV